MRPGYGQMHNRVDALEARDPALVPNAQIAVGFVEQHEFERTTTMRRELCSEIPRSTGDEDPASIHGFAPVSSLSNLKKPRLRALLMPQLTGTL